MRSFLQMCPVTLLCVHLTRPGPGSRARGAHGSAERAAERSALQPARTLRALTVFVAAKLS